MEKLIKEIIFYSESAFNGQNVTVELKNNKAKVIEGMPGYPLPIADLNESKILSFWNKMDEINVWAWNKNYEYSQIILDGSNWELKLKNRFGKNKVVSGFNFYPDKFVELIKELNNLFGTKIDADIDPDFIQKT